MESDSNNNLVNLEDAVENVPQFREPAPYNDANSQNDTASLIDDISLSDTSNVINSLNVSNTSTISRSTIISSPGSQESTSASHGEFKKFPILNRFFETLERSRGRRTSKCRACGKSFTTNESFRHISHAKSCIKIPEEMKRMIEEEDYLSKNNDHNISLTMLIVEGNTSLRIVDLPSFKRFTTGLNPDYKPPTRRTISNRYIPMLSNHIKKHFLENLKAQSCPTVSIEFDHWSDVTRRSLLGVVVTDPNGTRFLCDLTEARKHTTQMIVESLKLSLKSIPASSINSIISDSASSCASARATMVQLDEYKHIIHHRCIPHLLNRIGQYMSSSRYSPAIASRLSWAKKVTKFVYDSSEVQNRLRDKGLKRICRPTETRWYSTADNLSGLIEAKVVIVEEAQKLQDCQLSEEICDEEQWSTIIKLYEVFKPLVGCIAGAERKDGSLGEAVKLILEYGKTLFTADWSDPFINAALTSFLTYFGPHKLKEEFGLLLSAYLLDRRHKLDYITTDGIELVLTTLIRIAASSGFDIAKLKRSFLPEFESFCKLEDDYAQIQRTGESAAQWWRKHADSGRFQQVALRLANLRSSSANIERTFSALKYVQGFWRMRISIGTMRDMARLRMYHKNGLEDLLEIADDILPDADTIEPVDAEEPIVASDSGEFATADEELEGLEAFEHELEYLNDKTQLFLRTFMKYVNFSKVTTVRPTPQRDSSSQQISEIVQEFRNNYNRRTNSEVGTLVTSDSGATNLQSVIEEQTDSRATE